MCQIITTVVPADTDLGAAKPLLEKYGMRFCEIKNPYVEQQLHGELFLIATYGCCECDSALGSARREKWAPSSPTSHDVAKLRKKGWSEYKIERWLSQKQSSLQRHKDVAQNAYQSGLDHWERFATQFLSNGFAKRLGILLHFYRGSMETEEILIKRFETLPLSNDFQRALTEMECDVLYTISM